MILSHFTLNESKYLDVGHMSVISGLGRWREEYQEFKVILSSIEPELYVNLSQKNRGGRREELIKPNAEEEGSQ